MRTVQRFPVNMAYPGEVVVILMPANSKILDVQVREGQPALLAMVDTGNPQDRRKVVTYRTGAPIPDDYRLVHLGSFDSGGVAWHCFEVHS